MLTAFLIFLSVFVVLYAVSPTFREEASQTFLGSFATIMSKIRHKKISDGSFATLIEEYARYAKNSDQGACDMMRQNFANNADFIEVANSLDAVFIEVVNVDTVDTA